MRLSGFLVLSPDFHVLLFLQAVGKGAKFKDQVLTMAWYTPATNTVVSSLDLSVGVVTSTEDTEEIAELEEEEEEPVS